MSTKLIPDDVRAHIRWMIRRDIPEILALEHQNCEFPWEEKDFLTALREKNTIAMVAETGETVSGFILYELHRRRIEILKLVGVNAHILRQLLSKIKAKLSGHRRTGITFNVPERNLELQQFLRSEAFICTKVLRNYDENNDDSAYRMTFRIPKSEENDDFE